MLLRGRAGSRRSLHMPWVEVVRVRVRVMSRSSFRFMIRDKVWTLLNLTSLIIN